MKYIKKNLHIWCPYFVHHPLIEGNPSIIAQTTALTKLPSSPSSALAAAKLGAGQYINNVWRWSSSTADVRLVQGQKW